MNVLVRSIDGDDCNVSSGTLATFADPTAEVQASNILSSRKPLFILEGQVQAMITFLTNAGLYDGCEANLVWNMLEIPDALRRLYLRT